MRWCRTLKAQFSIRISFNNNNGGIGLSIKKCLVLHRLHFFVQMQNATIQLDPDQMLPPSDLWSPRYFEEKVSRQATW